MTRSTFRACKCSMVHRGQGAFLVLACLLLAGCFLVSDEEIRDRISSALPPAMSIRVGSIEKSLTCIAATFAIPEHFESSNILGQRGSSTESGLGRDWLKNPSFFEYVEALDPGVRRSTIEGTIVHARPCMESVNFTVGQLYDQPMIVTRSNSGKEILIVFDQLQPQFGIYLAQGR